MLLGKLVQREEVRNSRIFSQEFRVTLETLNLPRGKYIACHVDLQWNPRSKETRPQISNKSGTWISNNMIEPVEEHSAEAAALLKWTAGQSAVATA
jgi:hypothetical protein